jgi:AmiR/NasT family two-component response regulator
MASPERPVVWIIDNNHWERANIRAVLIERGFEVEGFVSIFHAVLTLYRQIIQKPDVIVLEAKNLPHRSGEIEDLARLGAPIILLVGVYENRELADKYKWAEILRRPFTIGQVARAVDGVMRS